MGVSWASKLKLCVLLLFAAIRPVSSANSLLLFSPQQLVEQSLAQENLPKSGDNFQQLADRVLQILSAFYPAYRFVVMVTRSGVDAAFRTDHTEMFQYNDSTMMAIYVTFAGNAFLGSTNCYGDISAEFQSCVPLTERILRQIGDICGSDGGFNVESVGLRAVVKQTEIGLASSLPHYAYREQTFGCAKNASKKWRVAVALYQDYQLAGVQLQKEFLANFSKMRSRTNGKLVSATDSGDNPLRAKQVSRDALWEHFLVLHNPSDNSTSFRARANGKFVTCDLNAGAQLIARAEIIQQWEKFELVWLPDGLIAIRAMANGDFVSVDVKQDGLLVANKDSADEAEHFEFSSVDIALENEDNAMGASSIPMRFPSPGAVDNGILVPLSWLIVASVTAVLGLLTLIGMCLCLCCICYKFGNIRDGFDLQMQAYWFLRIRSKKRIDRMLNGTAIDTECLLYSGPNSRVYFAHYRFAENASREVAVKVPSKEAFRMDMIIEETRINSQLRHPRIVEYIGYYRDAFKDIRIVSEFMEGGDLYTFIANRKNSLTVGHVLNFIAQIAEGMQYLASKDIIHRDLAARNCMLNGNWTDIKIADFGLSRHLNVDAHYTPTSPVRLPLRWTAIECLGKNGEILPNSKFSEKSDVWSFGIVAWECFTRGEMPYGSTEVKDVLGRLKSGWRIERPEQCPPPIYANLMLQCWHCAPEKRPNFSSVRKLLENVFNEVVAQEPEVLMREL